MRHRPNPIRPLLLAPLLLGVHLPPAVHADMPWRTPSRREAMEEPGGAYAAALGGPRVAGIAVGSSTWLRDTWILGDYEAASFWDNREEALYGSLGMTLRCMPRWRVAPFIGAGGAYHASMSAETVEIKDGKEITRGASHAAFIAETGVRITQASGLWEVGVRMEIPDVDDKEGREHFVGRLAWGKRW